MKSTEDNKSEKILRVIYELEKNKKSGDKITKEIMVVKAWKLFPSDFSMKGYPQYPNADISKYITALFRKNLLKGGFFNYKITEKGKEYVESKSIKTNVIKTKKEYLPRYMESEILRIKKSKVFNYFLKDEKNFLESDFFEFLGTSARSFKDSNKSSFLSKYNLIADEVIPYCKKNSNKDEQMKKIAELWIILKEKFGGILNGERK